MSIQKGLCVEYVTPAGLSRIGAGGGGGSALEIQDEGVAVDSAVTVINFIGADVRAMSGGSGIVDVYVPTPTYASHYNTQDGTTDARVSDNVSRTTARISTPTSEGTPFATNGWAGTNQSATLATTATFSMSADATGFGGDSTMVVTMYDADGTTALETHTTSAITANGSYGAGNITITVTNYATDTTRYKARVSITVNANQVFIDNGRDGGRYNVFIRHNTDTTTDGTGPYDYTQTSVFLDTNPNTPSIAGTVTVGETAGGVLTKHLSGIEYYISNSSFTASVTTINNLNRNTAKTTSNLRVSSTGYGISSVDHSPFGTGSANFSNWTNAYDNTGTDYSNTSFNINSSNYRYRGTGASISSFPRDTWGNGSTVSSSTSNILVDTYGTTSTNLGEYFDDEARRQDNTYNGGTSTGNWTSNVALASGSALVLGGQLLVPNQATLTSGGSNADWSTYSPTSGGANPDYSSLGAPVSYYRTIVDTTGLNRSSFTVTFTGNFVANATTDLANQDFRIYIRRRASAGGGDSGTTANPLSMHGAVYNFASFDDGVTNGQIRESSSSGNTVNCTFGGFSCEDGVFMEIEIVNTAVKITSLVFTFF